MPSRVLLISTNRCTAPDPVFPLGLAHLNAALRAAGHKVLWHDLLAETRPIEEVLQSFRPQVTGISLRNIDDVLIRKRATFYNLIEPLTATIRQVTGCPVVLGGSGFSIFPKRLLEISGADYGIRGEGEAALPALVDALEQGRAPAQIPGLVFRNDGRILVNPPSTRPQDQALTTLDRPELVTAHYLQNGKVLNLQTQRGCRFRCCYCTYPLIEGRAHLPRPAEVVADEFEQLQRLGAPYVFIVDSIFNSSARHVTEVCEALLRRKVKLPWGCFLRPQGLTPDLMKLMARAGLAHIEFGSDSFCDEVLTAYGKGLSFADILQSDEAARQAGVDRCHFLICGGPGETTETLWKGFQHSRRLQGAVVMAVVGMRIYPGTELLERAVAEGCIARDANLLEPTYYLAPGLPTESVFELLQEFGRRAPAWIAGDPAPAYARLVERLRQRGVVGPLWSYFAMIQRLWPQGVAGASAQ
jgi:radical SAM superfamily enzyme YgiQ (UPF0313 family)